MEMDLAENPAEMEKVFSCIYTRCDPENTNSVPVSNLLEVIKPFLQESVTQLEQLVKKLDPDNNNRCMSSAEFFEAMNQWASQIQNNDTLEIPREFVKEDGLIHSTPRPKDGYYNLLKSCSEIFNMSMASVGDDQESLADRVKQLQHEISITTNELDEVKRQLNQACEQNEVLASKLSEMTANFTTVKNSNDELQHYKLDHQDMKEELNLTKAKCEHLQMKLNENLRTHKIAIQELEKLESKKLILEDQLDQLRNKDYNSAKLIVDLRVKLEIKNAEISNLKASIDKFMKKSDENQATIAHLEQLLESSKSSLEKCLCKNLSEKAKLSPNLSGESNELSSPGLVQKILTGTGTKPKETSDKLLKHCLEKSVQPKVEELPKRHILDESLPGAFKNLPVMSPWRETITLDNLPIPDDVAISPAEHKTSCCPTPRRPPKSLKDEMSEVKSAGGDSKQHQTVSELEAEIESLKSYIQDLESSRTAQEYLIQSQAEQNAEEDEKKEKEKEKEKGNKENKEEEEQGDTEEEEMEEMQNLGLIWNDVNETTERIKNFADLLEQTRIFTDFLRDELDAVTENTDSTTTYLEKVIGLLLDYGERNEVLREGHQTLFNIRFEEYTASIDTLVTSFPTSTSVPIVQELSNLMVALAKLLGLWDSETASLVWFRMILEHVITLEKIRIENTIPSTPLENFQNEKTERDDAPLTDESKESFLDDRTSLENSEDVEEVEILEATLTVEKSPPCAKPEGKRQAMP